MEDNGLNCNASKENTWCVYMHTNKINGKKYIGITSKRPNQRWRNGKGYEPGQYFYNAIMKYGWDSFSHDILFSGLSEEDAKQKEIQLISEYNTTCELYGYNLTRGGDGALGRTMSDDTKKKIGNANRGNKLSHESRKRISESLLGNTRAKGHRHTEDVKKKISDSLVGNTNAKGFKHTEETRSKMSKSHIGIEFSESRRKKISDANRGRVMSDETKRKISESKTGKTHKGCVMSDSAKNKMSMSKKELFLNEPWRADEISKRNKIKVDKLSTSGDFICTYDSALDASIDCGVDNSSIAKACKGKVKTAGGYMWRYHKNI